MEGCDALPEVFMLNGFGGIEIDGFKSEEGHAVLELRSDEGTIEMGAAHEGPRASLEKKHAKMLVGVFDVAGMEEVPVYPIGSKRDAEVSTPFCRSNGDVAEDVDHLVGIAVEKDGFARVDS